MNLLLKESFTSVNLYNKIKILEISTINQMNIGMKWVNDNKINLALVGGTAVCNYLNSGRNLTPDVDYLVDSIADVKNKLDADNIEYHDLKGYEGNSLGITVPSFNIDFLDSNTGNKTLNKLVLKSKTTTSIGGTQIPIIIPELLAILKLDLGRTKDIDDGFALLQSGKLNKSTYINLVKALKGKLNDYESLVSYIDMIK